ncbi:hypothetical protein [Ureibacillus xyleni]|nr:hypothetical protein [Ureibacillus xyleni]
MRKISVVMALLLIACGAFYFLEGYRFTPFAAAKANGFVTDDYELVEKIEEDSIFYLFKSDEKQEYRTVHVKQNAQTYYSYASTFIPYGEDNLQTIGGMSIRYEDEKATLFVLLSKDEAIDSIVVHTEFGDEKKKILKDKPLYFLFPYSQQIDHINATAFDKNGNELYYYKDVDQNLKWQEI